MTGYYPEGLLDEKKNPAAFTLSQLYDAHRNQTLLEARAVLCDAGHNLHVDLGCMRGIIPRLEGALGIEDGSVRDIALISRVNKPVQFYVTDFLFDDESGHEYALLSRRKAQMECREHYISRLFPGDIIRARVAHLEKFGAFLDIGAGINALMPIDMISISRIPHPSERLHEGDAVKAVVHSCEGGKITLSLRELLGTWEENAALFEAGQTVPGIIRSVEKYGVFVEISPNLAGLAEPSAGVYAGMHAGVYIKSIVPEKMKIKLVIVDAFDACYTPVALQYYIHDDHIDYWRYSPDSCGKLIESVF